jgi:hypothetical protein
MLLGDSEYDYLIASGNPRQWTCNWQGDWIQVHKVPYAVTSAPIEPWGEDWESLRCPIYGRGCAIEEILGLDWRTGEIMSWDEVPMSE